MSKIAGIYWDDTAAAPGISLSVYFSGCHFHCPGCHNPETWNFDYGEPYTEKLVDKIIKKLQKNGVKRKLSILGGEPLTPENRKAVANLISHVHIAYPDTIIYIWTGYTYEELQNSNDDYIIYILNHINVLIDGRYEQNKRDTTLPLRGSTNQRIIYLKEGQPYETK